MKLEFDSSLQYQIEAINAATRLFEGQVKEESVIEYILDSNNGQQSMINGFGNKLSISEDQILSNLQYIQNSNEISVSTELDGMHFTVEMETGTGKTYVYIRSIYELFEKYGFRKFVIVVPSVAIREGVLKNLEITAEHFQTMYDNVPVNFSVYDSSRVSNLRSFASSNTIEILVMNIDSFAKDENIINKTNDRLNGQKPIEFIQSTYPIVIVDEPQNMETDKRREAIEKLNPLCTLRYSATHKNIYNLIYSLNPVKAYDLGLVKQIEVDSVIEENSNNEAYISLLDIKATKTKITAKVSIQTNDPAGVKKKTFNVKVGDDFYELSNEREIYLNGFIVDEIDASNGCITLSNGSILYKGHTQGELSDEIMKFQIRKTIEEHLKKEKKLHKLGIKVLSLFFIDKVSNYRVYDVNGDALPGKFAKWFEEIYQEYINKQAFKELNQFSVNEIHNGYFASDKKGKWKDTKETSSSLNGKDAADTFNLIMKDKEALLAIENPLKFIFSHSALREGWDNPNVFQICTLNETKSEIKKRQEIGRGLRLAVKNVSGKGVRIYDNNINRLTVIANESYEDFAKSLQKEIEEDCGVSFQGRVKNKRSRTKIKYRKGFEVDPKFLEIWEKIKYRTAYRVTYDTEELIKSSTKAIIEMPMIKPPLIRSTKVAIDITTEGVETMYSGNKILNFDEHKWKVPDVLGYIQSKTELTRHTIYQILKSSGRINDVLINPQLFLDLAVQAINRVLYSLMINGVKYKKVGDEEYEMARFNAQELEVYLNEFTFDVNNSKKSIYDEFIPLDSNVENRFAKDCESSEQIKFYFKLPGWFTIPTPIGKYNPDWAVVFSDEEKLYFVAETKDTGTEEVDLSKLKIDEQLKIKCGKAHFSVLDEIEYKVVNKVSQLK